MTTPRDLPWQWARLDPLTVPESALCLELPSQQGLAWAAVPLAVVSSQPHLFTLESPQAQAALDQVRASLAQGHPRATAQECFAACIGAVNDAAEQWLTSLDHHLGEVLAQTSAVLGNLETRGRDFGVSDVIDAQATLDRIEASLSQCIDNQLRLALAAHQAQATLARLQGAQAEHLQVLIEDIDAVEQHAAFMHERIRFLQATNHMALNVKQNQIVKVFSVITAVFLPALLISTYYSMNLANMPILKWQYGEPAVIGLTALLALLPLLYVKQRGWLR